MDPWNGVVGVEEVLQVGFPGAILIHAGLTTGDYILDLHIILAHEPTYPSMS